MIKLLIIKKKTEKINRANEYYKNNKERLKEKARNKYKELSEEEKNIKREYGKSRYHNMSEENKQRLKEYQKNYLKAIKSNKKISFFGEHYINKKPVNIDKVEIKKVMLSRKDSYSNKSTFKYFIEYISNDGIIPLCIKLPQMNIFAKSFDSNNKYMSWW